MTARSIRRAAERRAKKLARKAERAAASLTAQTTSAPKSVSESTSGPDSCSPETAEANAISTATLPHERCLEINGPGSPSHRVAVDSASDKRLRANRANALLSTGPRTPDGRAVASLNAVKTGLTGRTVLMPYDDPAEYQEHMRAYQAELAPVGQREKDLVGSIAQTAWRLKRIPWLEAGIFALGQLELAGEFDEYDPELRPALIHAAIALQHERKLRNLHLQESRLVRRREKELAELRQLQAERKAGQQASAEAVQEPVASTEVVANGFEFSTAEEPLTQEIGRADFTPHEPSDPNALPFWPAFAN